MQLVNKENILEITREWEGDRFPDGRPHVPDDIVERMKKVTIEEAWGVLQGHGYRFQFDGDWMNLHPDRVLVGRAVTCMFVPLRPDFQNVVAEQGEKDERIGGQNSWVIDTLLENDTIVVDLFGKVKNGTFAGDNLGNAIFARSRTGMVIDGGIRDLDGIYSLPDFSTFVRGVDRQCHRRCNVGRNQYSGSHRRNHSPAGRYCAWEARGGHFYPAAPSAGGC